jgi:hypothetical protein
MKKAGLPDALKEDITDVKLPAGTPKSIQDAVQRAKRYQLDTEFMFSRDFAPIAQAGPTTSAGKTWIEANNRVLRLAMGNDNIKAERLYMSLSPSNRALVQRGIMYKALEKASVPNGKYDAGRLKDALDSKGVRVFFPGKDAELLDGLDSIVHSSEDIMARHPWLFARGAHDVSSKLVTSLFGSAGGAGLGYYLGGREGAELGAATGSMAGFIGYIGVLKSIQALMRSQGGRNLMSAAGSIEKGSPKYAKVINHLAGAIWTPFDVAADPFSGVLVGP